MKKTFTANLNGTVFHIEEDAYDQLQRYLANIRAKFSGSNEAEEIMADIEARIAELFTERLQGRQAVSMADVDHVKQVMGQPEDYVDDDAGERHHAQAGHATQPHRHKRLYRDPDDKKVAGVLSGLGHYFGVDPLWLRIVFLVLLFAGWGFPALLYIAIWALVPEANTAAEKLEMQGEPVTVDNIKRMFDEGTEQFKAGASRMAGEAREMGRRYWGQGATYRREARHRAESAGHQVVSAIGRLLGLVFVLLAVLLLLGLFTGVIGGTVGLWQATWSSEHIGLLDLGSHLFTDRGHAFWFGTSVLVLVVIPIIGLFLAGFRLLTGTPTPRWLGWALSTLWVLALVPVIWATVALAKDLGRENSVRTELPLAQPTQGTLDLGMLAPTSSMAANWSINYDHGELDIDLGGIHIDKGTISGAWADVDIEPSNDSLFHLLLVRRARASTAKSALDRAGNIQYTYQQKGDVLYLSPVVGYQAADKIRGQEARFILQLPQGKSVFLRKDIRPMLDDIANTSNTYDDDMVGRTWTMTRNGLEESGLHPADSTATPPAAPEVPKPGSAGESISEAPAVAVPQFPNLFELLTRAARI